MEGKGIPTIFSSPEPKAKHPCVKGVNFGSNEGPCPFPRETITKFRKYIEKFKNFFSRTAGPISTKLGTSQLWVKGIQVCSNEGLRSFPRGR